MFGLSRWAGGLVARYGSRLPLTVGPFVAACGFGLFGIAPQNGDYWAAFFPAVAVMGLGMTISVAPLTTTVMNAVPDFESGVASGVNNAVSRLASLFAVAIFGVVLVIVFNRSLDQHLSNLALNATVRLQIDAARPQLAAAHNPDSAIQLAINESFLNGYRAVIWIATGLSALAGVCAHFLIAPVTALSPRGGRS
jgi:MFS family permease